MTLGSPRSVDPVPILLYHSVNATGRSTDDPWQVDEAGFRADMEAVVATGRTPLTATEYAAWLRAGGHPEVRPVLVTFDDGFADYADVALPILRELGLPATLFVTTGFVGRPGMLPASAVADLAAAGGTEIGGHSVTHPHLDVLPVDVARQEILDSRRTLEDLVGRPVTSFAYPHGSVDPRVRRLTADCGYTTAHAVKNALSHRRDDVYGVSRVTVHATTPRDRVVRVLEGTGAPLGWRRQRLRTRVYRLVRKARAGRPSARATIGA